MLLLFWLVIKSNILKSFSIGFLESLYPLQLVLKRPNSAYLTDKSSSFVFIVRIYVWISEAELGRKELTQLQQTENSYSNSVLK